MLGIVGTVPVVVHPLATRTVDDGLGNVVTTTFSYSDGFYDYDNREFRGFGHVQKNNPDGTTLSTWHHQDEYFKGKAYLSKFSQPDDGPVLTRTTFTWEKVFSDPPYNTTAFVKLTGKRTESYDDITVFTQADYTPMTMPPATG